MRRKYKLSFKFILSSLFWLCQLQCQQVVSRNKLFTRRGSPMLKVQLHGSPLHTEVSWWCNRGLRRSNCLLLRLGGFIPSYQDVKWYWEGTPSSQSSVHRSLSNNIITSCERWTMCGGDWYVNIIIRALITGQKSVLRMLLVHQQYVPGQKFRTLLDWSLYWPIKEDITPATYAGYDFSPVNSCFLLCSWC